MSNKSGLSLRQSILRLRRPDAQARPLRPARNKNVIPPATLFEIQPGFVLGARLSRSGHRVSRVSVRELEGGVLVPSAGRSNIEKPEEFSQAIRGVGEAIGNGKGSVGLLVPDGIVRISILEFESLPANGKEQDALIRWKMKSLLPFPVEEARLSFEVASQTPGHIEVLVAAIRNSVLVEYETLLEKLSGEVRLVLPSTAALLPLLGLDADGELLLHAMPGSLTTVVVEGQRLRLWRNQAVNWVSPEDWLATVTQETTRTLASAQDHLRLGIRRICLCARPPVGEELAAELGRAIAREVETLAPGRHFADKLSNQEEELFGGFGATLAGLLANAA